MQRNHLQKDSRESLAGGFFIEREVVILVMTRVDKFRTLSTYHLWRVLFHHAGDGIHLIDN